MTLFEEFLAFVKAKPRDETYEFHDIYNCALAQFGRSRHPDAGKISAGSDFYAIYDGTKSEVFEVFPGRDFSYDDRVDALLHSTTFGELADRLDEVLA